MCDCCFSSSFCWAFICAFNCSMSELAVVDCGTSLDVCASTQSGLASSNATNNNKEYRAMGCLPSGFTRWRGTNVRETIGPSCCGPITARSTVEKKFNDFATFKKARSMAGLKSNGGKLQVLLRPLVNAV